MDNYIVSQTATLSDQCGAHSGLPYYTWLCVHKCFIKLASKCIIGISCNGKLLQHYIVSLYNNATIGCSEDQLIPKPHVWVLGIFRFASNAEINKIS